jgi:hypothetical protein
LDIAALIEIAESPTQLSLQSFTRDNNEDWRINLKRHGVERIIERKGPNLTITQLSETISIRVNEAPNLAERQIALRSAMSKAIDLYPPWRDLSEYHFRLYLIIISLWLIAEFAISAIPVNIRELPWFQLVPMAGWLGLAVWIHYWYLV